jgi:urease accessory protein UreE
LTLFTSAKSTYHIGNEHTGAVFATYNTQTQTLAWLFDKLNVQGVVSVFLLGGFLA